MRLVRVLLVRRAGRDVRAQDDHARASGLLLRRLDGLLHAVEPDVLAEVLHVPAVGLVAHADVLGEGECRVALDRDVVVVVEDDQAAEAQVPGERAGLRRHAFLQVTVGDDRVGEVADEVLVEARRQHPLAERQADRRGDALAERPGGGLDPGRVAVLRMAGGRRAELAEVLEVVERDPVPGQVQDRVQEHRRVPGGEHEAVARGPVGVLGGVAHDPRVEQVGHGRERHRRARMTRVGLLDRVHRQRADGVDAQFVESDPLFGHGHCVSLLVGCREKTYATLGYGAWRGCTWRGTKMGAWLPTCERPKTSGARR